MTFEPTEIPDVIHIIPDVYGDQRGYFLETFQQERYAEAGINLPFVQDNESRSRRGVLRGLHFQKTQPQGKLVRVIQGEAFDVAVDIRLGSATFGKWVGRTLNSDQKNQLWVPPGFAHGFVVLSESCLFSYKCSAYYNQTDEGGIIWNDPSIGIQWPIDNSEISLSDKDRELPTLRV
ncbi:MAG TPA: dTDP-4-dehydrorhamnose 3,5-epimerase [Bacteroidetes bacterium]|nr:dTDP-4-dehydrorhamnose 3,5-epimerase [bacterium BMS3Bbin04]HDO64979.1 dTDP-4-dehydrorhamnose 3,5-epimerase [Bacteroidota bacterium]HEX04104.1 dTDP-4-dehydrorhamnose 3,5-epimerase [Bacteroidota bacterium]